MTVAALIVTHQSEPWLEATLSSVLAQTQIPDRIVLLDDNSTDRTLQIAEAVVDSRLEILHAATASADRTTRIAANFRQGLNACRDCEAVILGDHDDIWHPRRIEHQVSLLREHSAYMVASDGRLIDGAGELINGSLREAFPVPQAWLTAVPAARMRMALRWSIATGGASAVRPDALADVAIPDGWLHDRWWSLVATAAERMVLDPAQMIDYRVTSSQQVGLDRGLQDAGHGRRLTKAVASSFSTVKRIRALRTGLPPFATKETVAQLHGFRLLRNLS